MSSFAPKPPMAAVAAAATGVLALTILHQRRSSAKSDDDAAPPPPPPAFATSPGGAPAAWTRTLDAQTIAAARASRAIAAADLQGMLTHKGDLESVLDALAKNVKWGPFTATSGLELEYLLNAATNLLDKSVAHQITRMTLDVLRARFVKRVAAGGQPLLLVGGEVGGGVMVAQCAAAAAISHPDVASNCDFAYMRKKRKTSGTLQQLEAPPHITARSPESPALDAVWLDETNSTGSELLKVSESTPKNNQQKNKSKTSPIYRISHDPRRPYVHKLNE